MRSDGGVDLDLPQAAEIIFLITTMSEGVNASVQERSARLALFFTPAEAKAFRTPENFPAAFGGDSSSFNSRHD